LTIISRSSIISIILEITRGKSYTNHELKGKDVSINVNPAEQPDDWLIGAAQEIADAARERGLELPFAAVQ